MKRETKIRLFVLLFVLVFLCIVIFILYYFNNTKDKDSAPTGDDTFVTPGSGGTIKTGGGKDSKGDAVSTNNGYNEERGDDDIPSYNNNNSSFVRNEITLPLP